VKGYSLPKEGRLKLDWLKAAGVIGVVYRDIQGRHYLAVGVGDESMNEEIKENLNEVLGGFAFTQATVNEWLKRDLVSIPHARLLKTLGPTMTTQTTVAPPEANKGD
jgi:hypothetical protein